MPTKLYEVYVQCIFLDQELISYRYSACSSCSSRSRLVVVVVVVVFVVVVVLLLFLLGNTSSKTAYGSVVSNRIGMIISRNVFFT